MSALDSGLRDRVQKQFTMVLPHNYPLSSALSSVSYAVSSSSRAVLYVPVWGVFTGILLGNGTQQSVLIEITNTTYYSGAAVYSTILAAVSIYLYGKYRKGRVKVENTRIS